jgi:hypothetical protein
MKITTTTFILLLAQLLMFESKAQQIVLETNNNNILYSGYDNLVDFGTKDGRAFELVAKNAELFFDRSISDSSINRCIIRAFYRFPNKPVVYFVDPTSKEIFDSILFTVLLIPKPDIFLGEIKDGGKISKTDIKLSARSLLDEIITINFEVVSWELIVPGVLRTASGQGNTLNLDAASILEQAKPGSMISFMTQVRFNDGSVKRRSANFTR